jgi:hypothetical protein
MKRSVLKVTDFSGKHRTKFYLFHFKSQKRIFRESEIPYLADFVVMHKPYDVSLRTEVRAVYRCCWQ